MLKGVNIESTVFSFTLISKVGCWICSLRKSPIGGSLSVFWVILALFLGVVARLHKNDAHGTKSKA